MIRAKTLIVFTLLAATQMVWTATADAGPLMDWIQRRRAARAASSCQQPMPACGTCTTTCQQTCQRTVVNYVPYTAYRTSWERVPVTTYRQSTSTDPCTGCTVTCNRPCTTYTWRMKQVPFTTYRPVYRTETYQVPVTYTTPAPAMPCNTCAPTTAVQQVAAPACSTCAVSAPAATYTNGTTYYEGTPTPASGSSVPADTIPTLSAPQSSSQKPTLDSSATNSSWPSTNNLQTYSTQPQYSPVTDPNPANRWNQQTQLMNPVGSAANAPSVARWNYSPVKLASYEAPVDTPVALQPRQPAEYVGTITVSPGSPDSQTRINEGWRTD